MNVSGLLDWINALPSYRALLEELQSGASPSPLGLLRTVRPAVVAAIASQLTQPIVVIAGNVERTRALHQSILHWHPDPSRVLRFPEPPALFYERAPWPRDTVIARLSALHSLALQPEGLVIVTSARALMQPTMPRQQLQLGIRTLKPAQMLDLEKTLRRWTGLGYEPVSVVEEPGQFSHRGGIIDIFPPTERLPIRIELFGNQIESIRSFEPATQRSQEQREETIVTSALEALPRHGTRVFEELVDWFDSPHPPELAEEMAIHREGLAAAAPFPGIEFYQPYFYSRTASLIDHAPASSLLILDDPAELEDTWDGLEEQALELRETAAREGYLPPDYPIPYLTWDQWQESLADRATLILGHSEGEPSGELSAYFSAGARHGGQLGALLKEITQALASGERVVVASRQAERLANLWAEDHEYTLPVKELRHPPKTDLTFVLGPLDGGWRIQALDPAANLPPLHLLTDAEVFGWRMPEPRRPVRRYRVAPESLYADLTAGDFVVHIDYGIGVFRGLTSYKLEGQEREYLLVEYSGRDRLFVPIDQADRLNRFVGADDRPPQLSRLGSVTWGQVKAQARKDVEQVARDLLELYAARETAPGYAFSSDTPWQAELEAGFPYQETRDQAKAILAVKEDMERRQPMDRLVCGDVGYGKTEVALRAAFKAVMDGKQVAVLVPTTVLAQQHYTTFRHRLDPFPVTVEHLSRFRTRAEQDKILRGLQEGEVDIVIGTHRLLQKDVAFKDLGLVVIDEEQRFGVTHKERLKRMRTEVDVLTMTATPIPRTLYLSLTGVRDISVIETPPEERLPIATYVGPYDPQVARRAILREKERSGQVFYVHNRVQTIDSVYQRLQQLVPEVTIAVGHGQMRERELEAVMLQFASGEIDVLVCTSIIESGLDIPNANTLIIEQAEMFGLSQLYQLRGRVGRGARRAHAYLFHSAGRLNPDARQRLETIRETSDLGAGYAVAMRDLELRGAGEVLGTRQSGHISAIGFDLYTRLLARAVEEMRARNEGRPAPPESLTDIHIKLPLRIGLPPEYVTDTNLRLRLYRRLANLGSLEQIQEIVSELEDRFGPLPEQAANLMQQLRFKVMAREARVRSIVAEEDRLVLSADWLGKAERTKLQEHLAEMAHAGRSSITFPLEDDWRERLPTVLAALEAFSS